MTPKAERAVVTRQRIERAALRHFVEQGVHATSVRDIANTAGIVPAAIYNHFPEGKDELAWSLFITGWSEIGRALREQTRIDRALVARLHGMIDYVFRRFDEDWLLVTYVFVSRHLHLRRIPSTRDNPYLIFRFVIGDGMQRSEIPRGNVEHKTSLVIGAVIQTIDSKILGRIDGKLQNYSRATAAACLDMLRAGSA